MTSIIYALISCVAFSATVELTRRTSIDGFEAIFYRSLFSALFLIPVLMFLPLPSDVPFYFAAFISALVYMYGLTTLANLALEHNGRVAMMYQPITIVLTFIGWFMFDPFQQKYFLENKELLYSVIASFVVLFLSLHFIRRNDYAWNAFLRVAPVGVLFAGLNVLQKWLLGSSTDSYHAVLIFLFAVNVMMVLVSPLFVSMRTHTNEQNFSSLSSMRWGWLLAASFFGLVGWFCLIYAIAIANNPAFPCAISTLTPVCLMAYYLLKGVRDNASPVAGAFMTASAIVLALLTR